MKRSVPVLFAFLVVLAGCSGLTSPENSVALTDSEATETQSPPTEETGLSPPTEQPTQESTTEAETQTVAPTVTSTPTPTPEPKPENPWGKEQIVVGLNASQSTDRLEALIPPTLSYWNNNVDEYGTYSAEFVFRPDATTPDIEIEFEDDITVCGWTYSRSFVGCAPTLNDSTWAPGNYRDETEIVRIETGFSNETTLETLKHEFGHIVGLTHSDEPMPLMQATASMTRVSTTDAVNRSNPWEVNTIQVYADTANASGDTDEVREQVSAAIDYYNSGGGGLTPDGVTFELTTNHSASDISIYFTDPDRAICRDNTGSCSNFYGMNEDSDEALEYYTLQQIEIVGIDEDAVAWHVGLQLSHATGIRSFDELPEPFQDADYRDRRDEWWE